VPEIVKDGVNGLLVPPENPAELTRACLQLLQNRELASRIVQAGNDIAQKRFNISVQIAQLSRIYEEVSSQHGK